MLKFLDRVFRGLSQVMFQDNSLSGFLILVGLLIGSPLVGLGAFMGAVISTWTAIVLRYEKTDIIRGIYGFNGCLIGAAYMGLLIPSPMMILGFILATSFSTILMFYLSREGKRLGLPAMTLPFVLISWMSVLVLPSNLKLTLDLHQLSYLNVVLKNISQVYLVESTLAGFFILLGLWVSSSWAVLFAILGSVIAGGLSLLLELDMNAIGAGLCGFSAVLTSIALGCKFMRPTGKSIFFALVGITLSVLLHVFFTKTVGIVPLTAPFLISTWLLLKVRALVSKPTTLAFR